MMPWEKAIFNETKKHRGLVVLSGGYKLTCDLYSGTIVVDPQLQGDLK